MHRFRFCPIACSHGNSFGLTPKFRCPPLHWSSAHTHCAHPESGTSTGVGWGGGLTAKASIGPAGFVQAGPASTVQFSYDLPLVTALVPQTFAAAGGLPLPDGSWELPSDVSLFVDLVLDLDVGSMELGAFETKGRVMIIITDGRPEGAVATVAVDTRLAAIVVPDDDGVGLDVPIIEAVVGPEQRTYLLEKATGMALDLPKLRELL